MKNLENLNERIDLAAAFRWTARLNMHEAVANHFSLAINDSGTRFLMNPNQVHFSKIKASDLLVIDANDRSTLEGPNAPDITAWGLHGAIHVLKSRISFDHRFNTSFIRNIGKVGRENITQSLSGCFRVF